MLAASFAKAGENTISAPLSRGPWPGQCFVLYQGSGGRRAAATLYAFGNHARPLLCWREQQRPVGADSHYAGDMPRNRAGAEFILTPCPGFERIQTPSISAVHEAS